MARTRSLLQHACSLLLLAACSQALKFDLEALPSHSKHSQRCIRNFVAKDTLVVVTATIDGYRDDGMQVNMHVRAKSREGSSVDDRRADEPP
jgi:p24 family protein delta-1